MILRDMRERLRAVAAVLRRIIGAPDYERYRAHVAACHPGLQPMTREEFERSWLDARYSKPGQRCC